MGRIAVIDCGTNTFNLLIADCESISNWKKIHSMSIPVQLSPKGEKKTIHPSRMARAVDALSVFQNNIINYQVSEVFAFATAVFRTSENGQELRKMILDKTGIKIKIIDGDAEADYIYRGVKLLGIIQDQSVLIMDIGGGSTEFIIADSESLIWKKSFPLGVSKLHNQFKVSDRITEEEMEAIEAYMEEVCSELYEKVEEFNPKILVGTAGSFNSLVNMIFGEKYLNDHRNTANEIPMESYVSLRDEVIQSTLHERLSMVGLLAYRAPVFPVAITEIDVILKKTGIKTLIQSPYALKEGVIQKMMSGDKNNN